MILRLVASSGSDTLTLTLIPFSGTDFDLPPSALQTKARPGDVTAVSRRTNGPRERRPRPRNSAEAKVALGDNPRDWLGWVRKWLSQGRCRRRNDTGRENAHE